MHHLEEDRRETPAEPEGHATQATPPAYPVPGACPVCGGELTAVRLECGQCGTAVVGRFRTSRFDRLTAEQVVFLEAFLRARGNIRKVERELGMSYPTVRSRLNALLLALGIPGGTEDEDESAKRQAQVRRREILDQLESGRLSPEDAARQLRLLGR